MNTEVVPRLYGKYSWWFSCAYNLMKISHNLWKTENKELDSILQLFLMHNGSVQLPNQNTKVSIIKLSNYCKCYTEADCMI